jgi:hypothetical protein
MSKQTSDDPNISEDQVAATIIYVNFLLLLEPQVGSLHELQLDARFRLADEDKKSMSR